MNSLFGVELPPIVTFIIAFVIVLALIGAAAWLVRRFGAARLAAGRMAGPAQAGTLPSVQQRGSRSGALNCGGRKPNGPLDRTHLPWTIANSAPEAGIQR